MQENLYISEEELKKIDDLTEKRINEIRNSESADFMPANGCNYYYISNNGNDDNDGHTPETAWKTLSRINKANDGELKCGDVVCFERGGLWRGKLECFTGGVSYTAYGKGDKPKLYSGPQNYSGKDKWFETDCKNIYVCCDEFDYTRDIGFITLDGGMYYGIKDMITFDKDKGTYVESRERRKYSDYKDLSTDCHFFHEWRSGKLYFYSDKGNPGERFSSIELSIRKHGMAMWGDNISIDNFCIKYIGAHGIAAGDMKGLHVTNCEIGWIGGSSFGLGYTPSGEPYSGRYGNGVEIYGSCDDYVVENCLFYQIYDAAFSHQCSVEKPNDDKSMKNIIFRRNVVLNAYYSIEYFLYIDRDNPSHIENALYEDNILRFSAHGMCEQRPDTHGGTHIKTGRAQNPAVNFVIRNNIFDEGRVWILAVRTKPVNIRYEHSLPFMINNTYIQSEDRAMGFYDDDGNIGEKKPLSSDSFGENEAEYIKSFDKEAKVYIKHRKKSYSVATDVKLINYSE